MTKVPTTTSRASAATSTPQVDRSVLIRAIELQNQGHVAPAEQLLLHYLTQAPTDPVAKPTRHALEVFQVIFLVLSIGLFVIGLWISVSNHRELEKLKPKSAAPKAD